MRDLDDFLREAVFYPCSELDGDPIKHLAKGFNRYFYVDYNVSQEKFVAACNQPVFFGYQVIEIKNLPFDCAFGASWDQIRDMHQSLFTALPWQMGDPFIIKALFKRMPSFDENYGPQQFEIVFARCEAIVTLREVFVRRAIAPKCLVSIRPGNFGGEYAGFGQQLVAACEDNAGGLPEYLLCDHPRGMRQLGVENQQVDEEHRPANQDALENDEYAGLDDDDHHHQQDLEPSIYDRLIGQGRYSPLCQWDYPGDFGRNFVTFARLRSR